MGLNSPFRKSRGRKRTDSHRGKINYPGGEKGTVGDRGEGRGLCLGEEVSFPLPRPPWTTWWFFKKDQRDGKTGGDNILGGEGCGPMVGDDVARANSWKKEGRTNTSPCRRSTKKGHMKQDENTLVALGLGKKSRHRIHWGIDENKGRWTKQKRNVELHLKKEGEKVDECLSRWSKREKKETLSDARKRKDVSGELQAAGRQSQSSQCPFKGNCRRTGEE